MAIEIAKIEGIGRLTKLAQIYKFVAFPMYPVYCRRLCMFLVPIIYLEVPEELWMWTFVGDLCLSVCISRWVWTI